MKKYEWAIIGGGIAGISIAEILTREGHSCVLIEKNKDLASETSREFHEWLHTGALYTLIPDRLVTIKFILGAIDDLLEYYSSYDSMNLKATEKGLVVNETQRGWFDENYIHFKFRLKRRKWTFPWIFGVARAIFLIEKIKEHDWLRRRAGEIEPFKKNMIKNIVKLFLKLMFDTKRFFTIQTSDLTIKSRNLLRDLVSTSISNGLELSLSNEINEIKEDNKEKILFGSKENIIAERVVICNGNSISTFCDVKTKTSFAPIAVVTGLSDKSLSFVELDYFTKNCINLLTKDSDIGLVGGISFNDKNKCDKYLDFVINEHKKIDPNIEELFRYNGVKTEITFNNQPRGYLYHIVESSSNVWAIVPGKFTLAFSLAPEFYRRIYKRNPKKHFQTKSSDNIKYDVSNTVWEDQMKLKEQS